MWVGTGSDDGTNADRVRASLPALRKWLGAYNTATMENANWRANTPEALLQFMEAGDNTGSCAELSSETTFMSPSEGVTAAQVGTASVDSLLNRQARRHDALDQLLAAHSRR